jgi:hypothetical protein
LLRELLAVSGYAMHERTADHCPVRRVAWLAQAPLQSRDKYDLAQRRIGVVHPEPGAADALAEALRARGAQVIVLSLGETGLSRAEALDPDVVVVQPERFLPEGSAVVGALWQHAWLCWTPVLFVPSESLGSGSAGARAPDVRELAVGIHTLCADYDLALRRARRREPFQLALAQLGPVRTLRAMLDSQSSLRLRIETPQRTYELDVGEGLLIGASSQRGTSQEELLGVHALTSLLASTRGQVSVRPVAHPALTNIMAPLEAMLLSECKAPPLADPAAERGASQPSTAPGRYQSTLVGIPVPLLRLPADNSDGARARPIPLAELGALSDPGLHAEEEQEDASPTSAFSVSALPPRLSSGPEQTVGGLSARSPQRNEQATSQLGALLIAHRNKLAIGMAVVAVLAFALAALPVAERTHDALPAPRPPVPAQVASQATQRSVREEAEQGPAQQAADAKRVALSAFAEEQSSVESRRALTARAGKLVLKGHRLRRRGRLRAAHDAYRSALEVLPGFPRALAGLTEVYLAQRDHVKALETAQQLLEKRPRFADDQRLLGDVYMLAGRAEDALSAWMRGARQGSAVARARLKKHRA